jgi:hypothetical protein
MYEYENYMLSKWSTDRHVHMTTDTLGVVGIHWGLDVSTHSLYLFRMKQVNSYKGKKGADEWDRVWIIWIYEPSFLPCIVLICLDSITRSIRKKIVQALFFYHGISTKFSPTLTKTTLCRGISGAHKVGSVPTTFLHTHKLEIEFLTTYLKRPISLSLEPIHC